MIKFFRRYQSLKKFGFSETEGIEMGKTYVFPKIDGSSGQAWYDGEQFQAGSRNRILGESSKSDNAGFCKYVRANDNIKAFLVAHPNLRLMGEWLKPHTLRTYRADAWDKFYIFDVIKEHEPDNMDISNNNFSYLSYEEYQPMLEEFGLDYIMPLGILKNATEDNYIHYLNSNGFLIEDGKGNGEGVVIKNYDYTNKFGKIIWAKIVANEFKEKHYKTMGAPEIGYTIVEEEIANQFLSEALIEKEFSKIVHEQGEWHSKYTPRLLQTCYHCVVTEELWDAIKKFHNPTVNFKALRNFCVARVKQVKPDLFQ